MKTLESMTKDERSLLLYLETRAVDYGGKVDTRHMNAEDMAIAKNWNTEGFVKFGRIKFHDINILSKMTHWCELSDEAWTLAHQERRARCTRIMKDLSFGKEGVS